VSPERLGGAVRLNKKNQFKRRGETMIRNLKALGLALVAVFAMSAVAASAASAQTQGHLTSETGEPVTLIGTETGGAGANALTAFGTVAECPGSIYTGHALNSEDPLESSATAGTLTAHFNQSACATGEGREVTIETNGCDITLEAGETVGQEEYEGGGELVCPLGKKAHVGVWSAGSNHTEGRLCTLEFGAQSGSGSLRIVNTPAGDVDVVGAIGGIQVTRHGLCLLDGKGTTTNSGEVHVDATVEATNAVGEPVGISASD
jgi:hypothetical protein